MSKNAPKSVTPANPWIPAFRVGTHVDLAGQQHVFSESDLQDIHTGVLGQLQSGFKPPLVKGHPRIDSPREGSIVDAKLEDGVLHVKADELNPAFAEDCRKGLYKYVSSAFYKDLKKGLRHLGVLGATPPAIKGLGEIAFGEGVFAEVDSGVKEDDVLMFASNYDWDTLVPTSVFNRLLHKLEGLGSIFRRQRDALIESKGVEEADKVYPDYLVKDIEDIRSVLENTESFPKVNPDAVSSPGRSFAEDQESVPDATPAVDSGANTQSAETDQLRAENADLKARLDAAEKERAAAKQEGERTAFSEKLTGMVSEGRLLPGQRVHFERLFDAMQGVPVDGDGMFGEGDDRLNPTAVLDEMLSTMPKVLEFGEVVSSGVSTAQTPQEVAARLEKYKAEQETLGRELTFAECVNEINNWGSK